uniref:60S ribosomal export protein NMD3 n=1 Tax=Attheya septentrionalis TaxID=420275 RepID=A0A7S2XM03_9STRA|mmetsp:Transcript_20781/g.37555  ORF Transcript_20781/g.37555 Transcript_20781/m.37555 type:complete len:292 (+) Transcript_20781:81-956(+)
MVCRLARVLLIGAMVLMPTASLAEVRASIADLEEEEGMAGAEDELMMTPRDVTHHTVDRHLRRKSRSAAPDEFNPFSATTPVGDCDRDTLEAEGEEFDTNVWLVLYGLFLTDEIVLRPEAIEFVTSQVQACFNSLNQCSVITSIEIMQIVQEAQEATARAAAGNRELQNTNFRFLPGRTKVIVRVRIRGRCRGCGRKYLLPDNVIRRQTDTRGRFRNLRLLGGKEWVERELQLLGASFPGFNNNAPVYLPDVASCVATGELTTVFVELECLGALQFFFNNPKCYPDDEFDF